MYHPLRIFLVGKYNYLVQDMGGRTTTHFYLRLLSESLNFATLLCTTVESDSGTITPLWATCPNDDKPKSINTKR